MLKEDRDVLKKMIYDYDNEGILKGLVLILRELADEQSDLDLKDKSIESAKLADILVEVRSKLKIGRYRHAG